MENGWMSVVLGVSVVLAILGGLMYFGPKSGDTVQIQPEQVEPDKRQLPPQRPGNTELKSEQKMEIGARRQIDSGRISEDRLEDDHARKKRRLLSLEQTCEHWTRKNTRGQFAALQASACTDMQKLAAEMGLSTDVTITKRARQPSPARRTAKRVIRPDDCKQFGVGSIRYRRCRADEKEKLGYQCHRYKQELHVSTGAERESVRAWEQAWCVAYNHYQVVR